MLLRSVAVFLVFVLAAGYLTYKLSEYQVGQAAEWKARANTQQLQNTEIPAARGTIYDSNMQPMAESARVWTVVAAPDVIAKSSMRGTSEKDAARLIAREFAAIEALELNEEDLYRELADEKSKYYMVKARIEKPYADAIRDLQDKYNFSGIYLTEDTKRYYPYEDLAASLLGFTNSDGQGTEGIEWQYDEILSGVPGRLITARDANGFEMPSDDDSVTYPAEDGKDIVLTLNTDIQRSLEENLAEAVAKYNASERGMGIVMDVNTGAILAMATVPSFNPNEPYYIFDSALRKKIEAMPEGTDEEQELKSTAQGEARMRQWRNKAVSDSYEPGSVFKAFTAAAALDSGKATVDSTYQCTGNFYVEGWDERISCANEIVHGQLDLRSALIQSCNESFVQIGQSLGSETWYDYVKGFGLTEPTGVDLPGEPSQMAIDNVVYSLEDTGPVELASCSFGQSNKYTALQMITGFSAIVNGGYLVQPHIVSRVLDKEGNIVQQTENTVKRQVISNETSRQLSAIMEDLVADTNSSGSNAYVAGYHVGGKSGTSQKLEKMPEKEVYISSFMGFAPANNPQIAVLFVLDEPEDSNTPGGPTYFGGRLAAPSVRNIIADTVRIMGIEGDYEAAELNRTTVGSPALVNTQLEAAKGTLESAGLTAQVVGGGQTVKAQSPEAGIQIPRGGTVVLYTEDNPQVQTAQVGNYFNQNAQWAIETLKSMGFNVLTKGAPEDGENIVVVSQSVEANTELPIGTVIELDLQNLSALSDH